ncbi:MAG: thioesterase [Alphaproteobacteria bacterium]|nr:MAG: thioesterase [Alphaproteobacteria bacterium]
MEAKPVELPGGRVLPAWIDYNGHMNVAYYVMAFDLALDRFFEDMGIGPSFVRSAGHGPYALQTQLHYLAELREGESFRFRLMLLDCDHKRVHCFMEMLNDRTGAVAATMEQVSVNVDLSARRSAPYPDWAQARLAALRDAHAALPRPPQVGAPIGLRRKPAGG